MDIVQHISELLFEHDCVIVHGFGGFVANYQSAKIHPVQHTFSPPVKNILFNKDLRSNDGLLANRIVSHEHISYKTALELINTFSTSCLKKLNNGETVNLGGIGQLYPDNEGNIQFEQTSKVNFLKDSYGMSSFVSPAIQRHSNRKIQEIRPNFADRQKSKNPKIGATVLLRIAASVAVLAILSIAGYNFYNSSTHGLNETSIISPLDQYVNHIAKNNESITTDYQDGFSELNTTNLPEQSTENQADVDAQNHESINSAGLNPVDTENIDLDEANPMPVSNPDTKENIVENSMNSNEVAPETVIPDEVPMPLQKMYHLIAGSFQDTENANTLIELYQQRGYEPQVIGPAENGYYRVSISAYLRKSEALVELRKARDLYNPNIWLLRN